MGNIKSYVKQIEERQKAAQAAAPVEAAPATAPVEAAPATAPVEAVTATAPVEKKTRKKPEQAAAPAQGPTSNLPAVMQPTVKDLVDAALGESIRIFGDTGDIPDLLFIPIKFLKLAKLSGKIVTGKEGSQVFSEYLFPLFATAWRSLVIDNDFKNPSCVSMDAKTGNKHGACAQCSYKPKCSYNVTLYFVTENDGAATFTVRTTLEKAKFQFGLLNEIKMKRWIKLGSRLEKHEKYDDFYVPTVVETLPDAPAPDHAVIEKVIGLAHEHLANWADKLEQE